MQKQKSLTRKIKESVAGLIDSGAHVNAAESTKFLAKKLGLPERLVNYTHTEIRNKLNESRYISVPFGERVLFVPQCLRNSQKCKAVLGDEGWICKECGNCKIYSLAKIAEKYGYSRHFIVPGGSMVKKLIEKYRPSAVLGVACFNEVNMAMDNLQGSAVAHQAVLLLRDGCKDTDVNVDEVEEKLRLIERNCNGNNPKNGKAVQK
ncbi:MAG: DUF116 domain-containing protein [Candidatus Diapherotrites archaeon]|uniref:DUF116 domain-containing protein n=1 Tax=Candidatus Iainarchaeum sp. TaxID=3101447 RepID=A0A8T4KUW7_9ARCH|nr:DUF116 domain-containing protein [Candidatus Diapherotrites archaeon]